MGEGGLGLKCWAAITATTLPANQYVGDCGPLHWAVAAESKAGLTVDVLRVADVRAIIALVDGYIYSCSFRVRLRNKSSSVNQKTLPPTESKRFDAFHFGYLWTYHIAEDEAWMGEFEVFEQAVEFAAVQRAPGTVKIISSLRLLPRVVVVQELNKNRSFSLEGVCV